MKKQINPFFPQTLAVPGPHFAGNRENPFAPEVNSLKNRFFEESAIMKRIAFFIYGTLAYVFFLITFLYLIGFAENLLVPKSVDTGEAGPFWPSLWINVGLIALFGIQHAIMARPAFKQWWTRIVPAPIERNTFVLFTCLILSLMYWQWQPMPTLIWNIKSEPAQYFLYSLSALGWGIALLATFQINHFDLFGLRQVWLELRGKTYTPLKFKKAGFYKIVRHPLMLGFLIAFWSTPALSVGHLVLAGTFTLFILLALNLEERDLMALHDEDYKNYMRTTPRILPLPKKKTEDVGTVQLDIA